MELLNQSGQNFQEGDFKIGVNYKQTEKLLYQWTYQNTVNWLL